MSDPERELIALQQAYPGTKRCEEGGTTLYFIPNLPLPDGCTPHSTDALLCPTERDGYPSRLFFAERVQGPVTLNWNMSCRILERNWTAFSWQAVPAHSLVDLVHIYVRALLP